MKRSIALVLSGLLALLTIAGCGGSGNTQQTTAAPTTAATSASKAAATEAATTKAAAAEQSAKDLKFVSLKYYIRAGEQEDSDSVQKVMDEYLKEKLNCTVTIFPVSEWVQKMPLVLSSGEQVDLTFDQVFTGYYTNSANNIYLPLNELLEQHGQGIIETSSVNCPGILDGPKIKGVLYGIPCQKQTAQCEAWYFRKDICDKYNMDISSLVSLQDLEPYLQIIKENEPEMVPYYVASGTGAHQEFITDVIKEGKITKRVMACTHCGNSYVQDLGNQYEKVESYVAMIFNRYSPYMVWVFLGTAGIWSIFIGVFIIIAQKNEEKEKAKRMLINYVIGLVAIFAILVACPLLIKGIAALVSS